MKQWATAATFVLAARIGGGGCVEDASEVSSSVAALIDPEEASVIEAKAAETLTLVNSGPVGILEGTFRIKVGGAWSQVGAGLYPGVSQVVCITPGRIAATPGNVLRNKSGDVKWYDWSRWID